MKKSKLVLTGIAILMCSILVLVTAKAVFNECRRTAAMQQPSQEREDGKDAIPGVTVSYPAGLYEQ